jgi:ribosomal protein S18 acetylase RimI-like enzyme
VNSPGEITLRPVGDADEEFLLSVYASSRAEELASVPWTAEQKSSFLKMQFAGQTRHYRTEHPAATHQIICFDRVAAGRLYLDRSEDKFHILDVTILTEFRNSGLGTAVLRQIMAEAEKSGKPVTIYVESFNRSLRLFERLGFRKVAEQGFHWLMQWPAEAAAPAAV